MGRARSAELPPELQQTLRKARRLEWLTIAYLVSAVVLLALVLGSSQAMKTAWIEDLLRLIPPIAVECLRKMRDERIRFGRETATWMKQTVPR